MSAPPQATLLKFIMGIFGICAAIVQAAMRLTRFAVSLIICVLRSPFAVRLWDCKASLLSLAIGLAVVSLRPETRDLFLDNIGVVAAIKCALLIFFVWVIQIYHSAVSAIDSTPRNAGSRLQRSFDRMLPIILGLMPVVIILLGIQLARQGLLLCEKIADFNTLRSCLGGYVNNQTHLEFQSLQEQGDITAAYSVPEVDDALASLRNLSVAIWVSAAAFLGYIAIRGRMAPLLAASTTIYLSAANATVMGCLLIAAFYWPVSLTASAGGLLLLPILLGTWLPLVDVATRVSRRVGWPVVTTALGVVLLASSYVDRFHDVRIFHSAKWASAQPAKDSQPDGRLQRQMFLDDAIDRWMAANGCASAPASCPRPVLVAAEGGGSRAAFFTATVLGTLVDATRADSGTYHDFRNSLFAISGVSGGSVGATIFRTAMSESSDGLPPCQRSDLVWFGSADRFSGDPHRDPRKSWRSCLQLLTAGDFLSPVIVGLSFRDSVPVLSWSDRSVLLENAIERHYGRIAHDDQSICGDKGDRGLCAPFGYLAQASSSWMPLLVLNATSMDNGRPVLVSDVHTSIRNAGCSTLSVVPENVFELFATYPFYPTDTVADQMPSCAYPGLEKAGDLRLSTAAVLSARFPVISPAGWLRYVNNDKEVYDKHSNTVTSHVVDGGYFDNSGLETIAVLLPALQAKGLKPLVIHLANEPRFYKANIRAGRPFSGDGAIRAREILPQELEPPAQGFWSQMFSLITEPLDTVLNLRSGHQEAAHERMLDRWGNDLISVRIKRYILNREYPPTTRNLAATFCVHRPAVRRLTYVTLYQPVMSWWLSHSSQRSIDAQLCDQENINNLSRILRSAQRKPS